jgi:hypothetical protein
MPERTVCSPINSKATPRSFGPGTGRLPLSPGCRSDPGRPGGPKFDSVPEQAPHRATRHSEEEFRKQQEDAARFARHAEEQPWEEEERNAEEPEPEQRPDRRRRDAKEEREQQIRSERRMAHSEPEKPQPVAEASRGDSVGVFGLIKSLLPRRQPPPRQQSTFRSFPRAYEE